MLISTSRKPSPKTRKFCKNFAHATGSTYINRGKMNMREVLLRALEEDEVNVAIVNEIKGNPSKVTFYSNKGDILLAIVITASLTNERLHILPKDLTVVSRVKKLDILSKIFNFELVDKDNANYIFIDNGTDDLIATIEFFNKFGEKSEFKIKVLKILEE
ncbi:MAG: ribonucleotide-diphosphate reductase subunit beta [Methanobrevibacter sp.]|uniref:ribonucleotide-diphosphate reductase subunit beta n=1 Tax=Methanobrevibacter sp. TaxID=66852 RepID=UPI0026DFA501|nr:ribonucleotide-diphosphate reductase subunit beta [Methanobrevibacter sp.]MDO5849376.1 ribonucleotide-diphosphate reductase subunit beta [Methanobrevibacter sp.]